MVVNVVCLCLSVCDDFCYMDIFGGFWRRVLFIIVDNIFEKGIEVFVDGVDVWVDIVDVWV